MKKYKQLKLSLVGVVWTLLLFQMACNEKESAKPIILKEEEFEVEYDYPALRKLSEYAFFTGTMHQLNPVSNLIPYELNSPLFSDYAEKSRFIVLPEGGKMIYHPTEVFDFPEGAILIKNFYYPLNLTDTTGAKRMIETRLLIRKSGTWEALTYVWNDDQTDAFLEIAGKNIDVSWVDANGKSQKVNYSVPSLNQCKSCHWRNEEMTLIGPSARQLDKSNELYPGGQNQLIYYRNEGLLAGIPNPTTHIPLPDYSNPASGNLISRARAYLEINCAHCHRPEGPAKNSALNLLVSETNPVAYGVGKTPVAAGKGSGGRKYDIVPGKPDESIFIYRMESNEPDIMMPELGRKIVHKEGIELIKEWIRNMK